MRLWRQLCLQTLLFVLLASCAETVEPTVLRFYVYADMPLTRVRMFVLDEAENQTAGGGFSDLTPQARVQDDDNLLFSIAVERTVDSINRNQAVLRFEGYAPDSSVAVRQTVRADFADEKTRLVRVWLSPACEGSMQCPSGESCVASTGKCGATPTMSAERFDATADLGRYPPRSGGVAGQCLADLQSDEKNCGACGYACEYPLCEQGSCVSPSIAPAREEFINNNSSVDFSMVYLRRIFVPPGARLAAVGFVSEKIGGSANLLVVSDFDEKPGALLASRKVLVREPPRIGSDAQLHGTEYVLDEPLQLQNNMVWVGFEAMETQFQLIRFLRDVDQWVATSLEEIGQEGPPRKLLIPDSPYVYALFYP